MVISPTIEFVQQSTSINPSGSRHLSNPAAGFLKLLNTGAGGALSFGTANTTGSGIVSTTSLLYARVTDFGDASGIYNMRFFLSNSSAFNTGRYRFLQNKNIHFVPNLTLTPAYNDTPLTLPSQPNLSGTVMPGWTYGSPWLSGIGDGQVSQYVWLAIEVDNNVPVGTFGGAGAGTLRYRLVFDYS